MIAQGEFLKLLLAEIKKNGKRYFPEYFRHAFITEYRKN